ncbi:hypothetical protein [Oryza sativa Japonica Group]|uniref:Uncharacterized protein n=1 Tax=Oryza sativa subsp. japonica TaxID=39947 RepID=Q9LGH2_ORYSJ|nr:hypothetical protein [Oryza sativa Japonica Group]BAB33017.1 hypothetical protein [Oryza sativa Japonica Group]
MCHLFSLSLLARNFRHTSPVVETKQVTNRQYAFTSGERWHAAQRRRRRRRLNRRTDADTRRPAAARRAHADAHALQKCRGVLVPWAYVYMTQLALARGTGKFTLYTPTLPLTRDPIKSQACFLSHEILSNLKHKALQFQRIRAPVAIAECGRCVDGHQLCDDVCTSVKCLCVWITGRDDVCSCRAGEGQKQARIEHGSSSPAPDEKSTALVSQVIYS